MPANDFKSFPVVSMVGVLDTLSSNDLIGFGNWKLVKNATARSSGNRQRAGGWRRLFADSENYNNADLHDQLTDRLSFYDSYSAHAMGGGDLSGYGYPYFVPSRLVPEFDVFPPARGPYCDVYYPETDGTYLGCGIFYPTIGAPYVNVPSFVSTTGIVAHWRLDEPSGTRVDVVSALNLDSEGTPSEVGIIGDAAAFHAGVGSSLTRASSAALQAGAGKFGFTGWIKHYGGVLNQHVLGKWGNAGSREYRIYLFNSRLNFEVSTNGIVTKLVTKTTMLPQNEFVFFACWYDPIGTINIKINNLATAYELHLGVFSGTSQFNIALDPVLGTSTLNAALDSLTFWKGSFPSEGELAALYHSGMGVDYPFDMGIVCNTGSPDFFMQSFVYISCPVHYNSTVVQGYGYGPQFPVYSSEFSYDYVYCDGPLQYLQGCREAVTMLGEIVSSTGRKLIAGTMSRVYEYNQSAGNWRILADGLGNAGFTPDQCGCNSVRPSMATMGLYLLVTNGFNYPMIYLLGETQDNCQRHDLVPISDLVALDITRAGGVVVWKGFAIFFDITEAGTRESGTFIWSDLEQPDSYIESDTSLAGRITLAIGETILAMEPLGNWLIAYTDKSFYRITLVGGEDIFNVEEIKGVGGNALKYKYSLINTGSAHMWLSENDVMYFTQFDTAPIHVPWITRAAGMIFNGIAEYDANYGPLNKEACNLVTGGWSDEKREAWLSWPAGDSTCPNATLRFNLKFGAADLVDHGFTSFLTFRPDLRPTVGEWMEDLGICPRATLVATGPKDGPPCSAVQDVVANPPLYIRNPEEDENLPVHPSSLCARLTGLSMDDFCVDCAAPATFITADGEDFTLKQQEDDYYFRERLGGSIEDYQAYSCTGQYYKIDPYDTVLQTGNEQYRTQDQKIVKRLIVDAEPLPQSTPSRLEASVGYGEQSSCMTWVPIRSLPFECRTDLPVDSGLRQDRGFKFPTWRRGKFLASRIKISGIGGGGTFSQLANLVKGWGQQDSP